ncbi:hypothetical protein Misp03_78420 [Microbispora sp. NBRC 16548]|nr:hypothetical protein Misp03_78420 [Microbispora sp. NBRC 16548]
MDTIPWMFHGDEQTVTAETLDVVVCQAGRSVHTPPPPRARMMHCGAVGPRAYDKWKRERGTRARTFAHAASALPLLASHWVQTAHVYKGAGPDSGEKWDV